MSTPDIPAGTWTIDKSHSEIGFSVRHLMVSKVKGNFETFEGTVTIADDPLQSSVQVEVDLSSINTRDEGRDGATAQRRGLHEGPPCEHAGGEPADGRHRHLAVDLGCESSTLTANLPDRMSASLALTLATRAAGTLPSKVPSGASELPLYFIIEYWP